MDTPVSTPALATEAVRTGWWVVDSPADTVYSWLKARLPTDEGAYSASSEGTVGTNVQFVSYSKPPTNLLGQRMVLAAVGSLSATRTVLRVDAQVVYRPVKPAGDEVPVTAYLLATVRPKVPPGAPAPSPISMTVTDRSTIAEIAGLVNALPTRTNGAHSCPLETDAGIYLTFKNDANGAARATVLLHLDGCDGVSVNIGGTVEPRLDPSGTAYPGGFSAEVAHLLGVTSH